jgi:hypothetical protein
MRSFRIPVIVVVLLSWSVAPAFGQSEERSDKGAFQKMASYLSSGTGRWRAPNENHDATNAASPEALGLWFERTLDGHLLELTIVGYYGGEPRITGIRAYWFWHPGRRQTIYQEISRSGLVRTGTAAFTNDSTFFTTTEAVTAAGRRSQHRGENMMLSDRVHRTTAYILSPEGDWVEQRSLTWTLKPRGR